jgi:beta-lactamase class A
MDLDRRLFILTLASLPVATAASAKGESFDALEQRIGGRLGIAGLDTGSGRTLTHRENERFPMCSTFKLLAVSAVLSRVDRHEEDLARWCPYGEADLVGWAPVARENLAKGGMTLGTACAAAASWSDNTAANLVLKSLGGPQAATRYVRAWGDSITRMDRMEPDANTAIPGDPRDTTTPSAMLADLKRLALGHVLSETSRTRLVTWLVNYRTLFPRLSAGFPADWRSAHKMGTGANGSTNDVAILWPPNRAPILVAAYATGSSRPRAEIEAVLADSARTIVKALA